MAYRFLDKYKEFFCLRWLLKCLDIYPNAYYNYRKNRKASYHRKKQESSHQIKSIYYNNNWILGHRPMKILLERKGVSLSKTMIHKDMKQELDLHAVIMRKKLSYVRRVKNQIFPNLLNQNFQVKAPNLVWCTDFIYIRLSNGE